MRNFLNYDLLRSFDISDFTGQQPFPWYNFSTFLTPEGFKELYNSFPSLALFEQHQGMERVHGQRPHNRYYLAYERSLYGTEQGPGLIEKEDLPVSWQHFITEIEASAEYHTFIHRAFDVKDFRTRYAWHVGVNGSEVSPHCDGDSKLGTHIFYFNTDQDWNEDWGGQTLVLEGKTVDSQNPDFSDFQNEISTRLNNNSSFLFKNTELAWHGVRPLTCPENACRRLFNVICEPVAHSAEGSRHRQARPIQKFKSLARKLIPNS